MYTKVFEISELTWRIADLVSHQDVFRLRCVSTIFNRCLSPFAYWDHRLKLRGCTWKFHHPRYAYAMIGRYLARPSRKMICYIKWGLTSSERVDVHDVVRFFVECIIYEDRRDLAFEVAREIAMVGWHKIAKRLMITFPQSFYNLQVHSIVSISESILSGAVASGDLLLIDMARKHGANISGRVIREAIINDRRCITVMLLRNSESNFDKRLRHATHVAARKGKHQIMLDLIRLGARNLDNALIAAVRNEHTQVIEVLLNNSDISDQTIKHTLIYASRFCLVGIIELLLDVRCDTRRNLDCVKRGDRDFIQSVLKLDTWESLPLAIMAVAYQPRMVSSILRIKNKPERTFEYVIELGIPIWDV